VIIVHTNKEREETENKENVLAVTKTVTEETYSDTSKFPNQPERTNKLTRLRP
jgi:hypothetical protein